MKQLLFIFLLLLTSCATYSKAYYGIADFEVIDINQTPNGYILSFMVHVGKDAEYYTMGFYVDNYLLYDEKIYPPKIDASYSIGRMHMIEVSEPAVVKIVITSYFGEADDYYYTDVHQEYVTIK